MTNFNHQVSQSVFGADQIGNDPILVESLFAEQTPEDRVGVSRALNLDQIFETDQRSIPILLQLIPNR